MTEMTEMTEFENVNLDQIVVNNDLIFVPKVPHILLVPNYTLTTLLSTLVQRIKHLLETIDAPYSFNFNSAEFNGVYASGSCYATFIINIYTSNGDNNIDSHDNEREYIIESRCISGDRWQCSFVLNKVRTYITTGTLTDNDEINNTVPDNNDELTSKLSEEEINTFFPAIKHMTSITSNIHEQQEGCKIICDMSYNVNFHQQLLDSGFIEILIRLMVINHFTMSLCSVNALLELTNTSTCMERVCDYMLNDDNHTLTIFLCSQLVNGSYQTYPLRKQTAKLLEKLVIHLNGNVKYKPVSDYICTKIPSESIDDAQINVFRQSVLQILS